MTTHAIPASTTSSPTPPSLRPWRTLTAAVLSPAVLWTLCVAVAHVPLTVHTSGADQPVGLPSVLLAALVGGAGALLVALVVRRASRRPRPAFLVVTGALLLLSLAGPLTLAASSGAAVGLVALHLAVGVTVLPLLARSMAPR